jgi:DMSO/TMAO reductase YedYZ molybdopterin-dependent catalytic subunit
MDLSGAIRSPDTSKANRVPPGQYLTDKWPVLHYGRVHQIEKSKWALKIFGLVKKERVLGWDEFAALPQEKVFSDIHCVTTWSRLDNLWEGVGASEIKNLVEISPEAKFVMVHGMGSFTTNLPLEDFFQPDVLFATKHDGQDINADHGGPVRLVVPRLYFWKSAKWVSGLEFMAANKPGFWEQAGYHIHGDPWTEERHGGRY